MVQVNLYYIYLVTKKINVTYKLKTCQAEGVSHPPVLLLSSYDWINNKIDTKPDQQKKNYLICADGRSYMMLREMIKAGSFLYFLEKETITCEDLTGQRKLDLGAH